MTRKINRIALLVLLVDLVLCKFLIFPTTKPRYKFIAGFGVPVEDLAYETVVIGSVFKASFNLPASIRQVITHKPLRIKGRRSVDDGYNSTVLDADGIDYLTASNATRGKDYERDYEEILSDSTGRHNQISGYRWAVYKGMEALGDRIGLVGRACVLKSICESAETPFHYQNGIYAEVLHMILTPSASVDRISTHSDNEYLHAEALGKAGAPCARIFKECSRSLLDHISDIYSMTEGFFKKFTK